MKSAYLPPRTLPKSRLRGVHASLAVLATLISVATVDKAAARDITFAYFPSQIETTEGKQRVLAGFKRTARRACEEDSSQLVRYSVKRDCIDELLVAATSELDRRHGDVVSVSGDALP